VTENAGLDLVPVAGAAYTASPHDVFGNDEPEVDGFDFSRVLNVVFPGFLDSVAGDFLEYGPLMPPLRGMVPCSGCRAACRFAPWGNTGLSGEPEPSLKSRLLPVPGPQSRRRFREGRSGASRRQTR
jgi:hypothetical protein